LVALAAFARALAPLLALLWLGAAGASAQVLPAGPVLAAGDLRAGASLDGPWSWSIDPYRDGVAGFHGDPRARARALGRRRRRGRRARPIRWRCSNTTWTPRRGATLPASWLTHAPEMRHYQGLVWYQRRFDAAPQPGMRYFVRFGAANYVAEAWLNGPALGRHEGGFTPFAFEVTGHAARAATGWSSASIRRTPTAPSRRR
jgi:beta-glucuronidase